MARTEGSGWGAGPLLYQVCPHCGKKKCYYRPVEGFGINPLVAFYCTACKQTNQSPGLIRCLTAKEAARKGLV